jgi:Txe/YoeB family toxin of Txe-Axe toxin-antitoxin module
MPEIIKKLTQDWENKINNSENLDKSKLETYYEKILEEGRIVYEIKDEWEDYFDVFSIIISVRKIRFESEKSGFEPLLFIQKSGSIPDTIEFKDIEGIDKIIQKIDDFLDRLPSIEEEEDEEEEDEDEDEEEKK